MDEHSRRLAKELETAANYLNLSPLVDELINFIQPDQLQKGVANNWPKIVGKKFASQCHFGQVTIINSGNKKYLTQLIVYVLSREVSTEMKYIGKKLLADVAQYLQLSVASSAKLKTVLNWQKNSPQGSSFANKKIKSKPLPSLGPLQLEDEIVGIFF